MTVNDTTTPNISINDNGSSYSGTTSASGSLDVGDSRIIVGAQGTRSFSAVPLPKSSFSTACSAMALSIQPTTN